MKPLRILHCHSTFDLGGKEARAVQLMNAFGNAASHVILTAVPGATGARSALDPALDVNFPANAPSLEGKPSIGRYNQIARYMQQFDLVLSYNWGSMDIAGARRVFAPFRKLPPLIHHEDGFNADEVERRNAKRNLYRRVMLPTAQAVIVPSVTLHGIAANEWHVPSEKLHRIPNGINTARYAQQPVGHGLLGFQPAPTDLIVGTLAGLREVKDLPRLVRAVAKLPDHVKLVIVGQGPEREKIVATADALGIASRVHLPGFLADPHRYVGLFDVFALSSKSEQFPISVVEAMAAGLPIISSDVGDVAEIVSSENRAYICRTEADYDSALARLVDDSSLRALLGHANRDKATRHFDENRMIQNYRQLYWGAVAN